MEIAGMLRPPFQREIDGNGPGILEIMLEKTNLLDLFCLALDAKYL